MNRKIAKLPHTGSAYFLCPPTGRSRKKRMQGGNKAVADGDLPRSIKWGSSQWKPLNSLLDIQLNLVKAAGLPELNSLSCILPSKRQQPIEEDLPASSGQCESQFYGVFGTGDFDIPFLPPGMRCCQLRCIPHRCCRIPGRYPWRPSFQGYGCRLVLE